MNILLVGLGGAAGSICRYLASGWVYAALARPEFPYGTLLVNVVGCLCIGFLNEAAEARQILLPHVRPLLVVGFLGGFTTFSAFGFETLELIRDGEMGYAVLNVLLQVLVGLVAVAFGVWMAKQAVTPV